jgi:hypothetical protein
MVNDVPSSRFHPYRSKGWMPFVCGLVVLFLSAVFAWGITGENRPFTSTRTITVIALVFLDPLGLFGLWLMALGIGIWRAHVVVTDEGLEIYAHRFSMWSLRKMRRAKLTWNEVAGVQPFALTNMLATDGVQREFIVYTSAGKFNIPELMWPDAQQIAAQISARIGKAVGDLSAVTEPVVGNRPSDQRGTRIMHGIGWFTQMMGWLFAALSIVALCGGLSLREMSYMLMLSMGLVVAGSSLRRFHMG